MAGELTAKAQEALNDIQLMQGEEIQYSVQADGFFLGTLPIQKMIASFQSMITKLTGGHIRVFLVMTNMRLIMIESRAQWCGCTKVRAIKTISSRDILECGSGKETRLCFVHTRVLTVESRSHAYTLVVKKLNDDDVRAFVTAMSGLIISNSQRS